MRRRKNFLPTFILIILLWISFALLIIFVEPAMVRDIIISDAYLPFFLNLFFALFLTLSIIFARTLRGLITTTAIVIYLILRLHGLGNWLNLVLIIGISFTLERYFTKKR